MKDNELVKGRLANTKGVRAAVVEEVGTLIHEYQQKIVKEVKVGAEQMEKLET